MTTANAPRNGFIGAGTFSPEKNPVYTAASPEEVAAGIARAKARTIERATYENETFPTGAVRDTPVGKGRFSRIPLEAVRRLADTLETGEERYPPRNWEKGIPVERSLDSALRHIFKYMDGWTDEDHLGAAFWNLMAAVTIEERAEAGRLPKDLLMESRQKYIGHPEGG